MEIRIEAESIERAYEANRPFLAPTRLVETQNGGGRSVFLKLETDQPTGSFKVRGALFNFLSRPEARDGFVAASAGNHALGVAWAAQRTERPEPVTIFVPNTAPETKIAKLRTYPVDLRVGGATFDHAEHSAHEFERETGAQFIHAYDDPLTVAGQGSMAIEIHEALSRVGTLIVPVGGGGLISGNAVWFKRRHPGVRMVAVQPDASPALAESIRLGRALLEYPAGPTLADGLSGGVGRFVFAHRDLIDQVVNVPEATIHAAIRHLYRECEVKAEASGAIALAAVSLPESQGWPEPIVCIITGGNIDQNVLDALLA